MLRMAQLLFRMETKISIYLASVAAFRLVGFGVWIFWGLVLVFLVGWFGFVFYLSGFLVWWWWLFWFFEIFWFFFFNFK